MATAWTNTGMSDRLRGASVSEQELYDALVSHEADERDVIAAYQDFAGATDSEAVRYLVDLIIEDEQRHHWWLWELANRVRATATLEERGPAVPYLDVKRGDKELLTATRRFLDVERKDLKELRHLARQTRGLGDELNMLMIRLLQSDTERHIRMLRFIEKVVRRPRPGHRGFWARLRSS
jgi:rubrerythrin